MEAAVLPCGECAAIFPTPESRANHRIMRHSDMFPGGDEAGFCLFCGARIVDYFLLFDHLKEIHPIESRFLVQMATLMNLQATTAKSPIYWLQVTYVREQPGPVDSNIMKVLWKKMGELNEGMEQKNAPTPPALTHLTTPSYGEDELIEISDAQSVDGDDASPSNSHAVIQEKPCNSTQPQSSISLTTIDLGNGRFATLPSTPAPSSQAIAAAFQATNNKDDAEDRVLAHRKSQTKHLPSLPSELMNITSHSPWTSSQLVALMGRPIVPPDTSEEELQALLEQQVGGASSSSSSQTSIVADDPTSINWTASQLTALMGRPMVPADTSQEELQALLEKKIDHSNSEVNSISTENMDEQSALKKMRTEQQLRGVINSGSRSSIMSSCAIQGSQMALKSTDVIKGPSASQLVALMGRPMVDASCSEEQLQALLEQQWNSSSSMIDSTEQHPNNQHTTPAVSRKFARRKRTKRDAEKKPKKIRLGDLAKELVARNSKFMSMSVQAAASDDRKPKETSNNKRLAIILTTLLGMDNRRDREQCEQLEREFTQYIGALPHSLPDSNEAMRLQLQLTLCVLRRVLEKPLEQHEPPVTETHEALLVAASFWVFLPPLQQQHLMTTLLRLRNTVALMMFQSFNMRSQLLQLSLMIEEHLRPYGVSAVKMFKHRMEDDVTQMQAPATSTTIVSLPPASAPPNTPTAVSSSTSPSTIADDSEAVNDVCGDVTTDASPSTGVETAALAPSSSTSMIASTPHESSSQSNTIVSPSDQAPIAEESNAAVALVEPMLRIWLQTEAPISCRYGCEMMAMTSGMVSHYRRYHYDVYYHGVHKVWEEKSVDRWLAIRFGNDKTGSKEKRACIACEKGRAEYTDRMHLAAHFKEAHPQYFEAIRSDYLLHFKEKNFDDPVIAFTLEQ